MKEIVTKTNVQSQTILRFTPASNLKKRITVLIPIFIVQTEVSKKLQPIRKRTISIYRKIHHCQIYTHRF